MRTLSPLLIVLVASCTWIDDEAFDTRFDLDGDGVPADIDCDPTDGNASMEQTVFLDADGDGLGTAEVFEIACGPAPVGWSIIAGDECDGNAELIRPRIYLVDDDGDGHGNPTRTEASCSSTAPAGLSELEDCNDDDATVFAPVPWFVDDDEDSYGTVVTELLCASEPPVGHSDNDTDCDDSDADVNPAAQEVCGDVDMDCDGLLDDDPDIVGEPAIYLTDADGDTYGDATELLTAQSTRCPDPGLILFTGQADCDDANSNVFPTNEEACDNIDNNCNDEVDEELALPLYYQDADNDEAPNPLVAENHCDPEPGWLLAKDFVGELVDFADCDDSDPDIYPNATETYGDGIDSDCDPSTEWDEDGDGFTRTDAPEGTQNDCNDTNFDVHPGADEVFYDATDDNCDGGADDDDQDRDGFDGPSGVGQDCDDLQAAIHPDATEVYYDSADNDCDPDTRDTDQDHDGEAAEVSGGDDCNDLDANIGPHESEIYYDDIDNDCDVTTNDDDQDEDGFLSSDHGGYDCNDNNPAIHPMMQEIGYNGVDEDCFPDNDDDLDLDGYVGVLAGGDDCDDNNDEVHPGIAEVPHDDINNDCNLDTLDDDADGDGYADVADGGTDCDDTTLLIGPDVAETYYDGIDNDCNPATVDDDQDDDTFAFPGDCNDQDNSVYPGAVEIGYDNIDQDCSPANDNDLDLDTYLGGPNGEDCDDLLASVNPGATEIYYNGLNDDCDPTTIDDDQDGDGFVKSGNVDCDDLDATAYPGGIETEDDQAVDNNCSGGFGIVCFKDSDSDGFGGSDSDIIDTPSNTCGATYTADSSDCDDNNTSIFPSAPEYCDGIDTDCGLDDDIGIATLFLTNGGRFDIPRGEAVDMNAANTANAVIEVCGELGNPIDFQIECGAPVSPEHAFSVHGSNDDNEITTAGSFLSCNETDVRFENITYVASNPTASPLEVSAGSIEWDGGAFIGDSNVPWVVANEAAVRFSDLLIEVSGTGTLTAATDSDVTYTGMIFSKLNATGIEAAGGLISVSNIDPVSLGGTSPFLEVDNATLVVSNTAFDTLGSSQRLIDANDSTVVMTDVGINGIHTPNDAIIHLTGGAFIGVGLTTKDISARDAAIVALGAQVNLIAGVTDLTKGTFAQVDDGTLTISDSSVFQIDPYFAFVAKRSVVNWSNTDVTSDFAVPMVLAAEDCDVNIFKSTFAEKSGISQFSTALQVIDGTLTLDSVSIQDYVCLGSRLGVPNDPKPGACIFGTNSGIPLVEAAGVADVTVIGSTLVNEKGPTMVLKDLAHVSFIDLVNDGSCDSVTKTGPSHIKGTEGVVLDTNTTADFAACVFIDTNKPLLGDCEISRDQYVDFSCDNVGCVCPL